MKQFTLNSFDGTPLNVTVWDDVDAPIGMVQISHGICEHGAVYNRFAEVLQSYGYVVFCNDLRCFGLTESSDDLGYHDGDVFNDSVKDLIFLNKSFSEKYKLPTMLFGHGYGSFICQSALGTDILDVKGVILSGTAYSGSFFPKIDKIASCFLPKKKKSQFVFNSAKSRLNALYKKEKGEFLWLTVDDKKRSEFLSDPLCSVVPSGNFYRCFFDGIAKLNLKAFANNNNHAIPIAIMSGRKDPVGGKLSKNAIRLYQILRRAGYETVRLFIYENARNQILHEVDSEVYTSHCLTFINRCFGVSDGNYYDL